MKQEQALHVCHILFRFDYGGMENGLVNLVNRLKDSSWKHTIIALSEVGEIRARIDNPDVNVIELGKQAGLDPAVYVRLFRLIRSLAPDIVHTRNIGTLDCQILALIAGVPVRIHGEHGWDTHDPHGNRVKYRILRKLLFSVVHQVVPLSIELENWLLNTRVVSRRKITRICNGVDCRRFQPPQRDAGSIESGIVIGSVTRFTQIKDPYMVIRAFAIVLRNARLRRGDIRLCMVGGGPLLDGCRSFAASEGISDLVEFAGPVQDVYPYLQSFDLFVQGSLKEGISNTLLEAMATGLPVVATEVGGNAELVDHGCSGFLIPVGDANAMAEKVNWYLADPARRELHSRAARRRVLTDFSLEKMAASYATLYRKQSSGRLGHPNCGKIE